MIAVESLDDIGSNTTADLAGGFPYPNVPADANVNDVVVPVSVFLTGLPVSPPIASSGWASKAPAHETACPALIFMHFGEYGPGESAVGNVIARASAVAV